MLTENEFNNARIEFANGNHNIDYAVRNLTVLDDEQIRIIDDFEKIPRDQWRRMWRPNLNEAEGETIEYFIKGRNRKYVMNWERDVMNILWLHMSNRKLYDDNSVTWEHVFFSDTYAEYVELEADS